MGVRQYTAAAYARVAHKLLPPGKLFEELKPVLWAVFLANGDELERVSQRVSDLIDKELDPRTTDELLPEWEEMLDLPGTGTKAQRRARIVARVTRGQRNRPADFQRVLAPILGLDADDVEVIEIERSDAQAMNDDSAIFRFYCYRDPSEPGSYDIEAAQEEITRIKPSHTVGKAIESKRFTCGDPHSLCGRDLLAPDPEV